MPTSRPPSPRPETGKSKKVPQKKSTKKGANNLEVAPKKQSGIRAMAAELLERFAPRWAAESVTTQDVLRKDLSFDLSDPQANFDAYAVDGKLRDADIRGFLTVLKDKAFKDGGGHEGWVDFQLAAIRSKFMVDGKGYLTRAEYDAVVESLGSLTLFQTPGGGRKIAVLGAGAFGIAMAVALGMGEHDVRILLTSSSRSKAELQQLATVINEEHRYPAEKPGAAKIASQLPKGYVFPPNVRAVVEPSDALAGAEHVVSAIPVQSTYRALLEMKDCIPPGVPITTVSKGICSNKYADVSAAEANARLAAGVPEGELRRDPTYMMTMDEVIELALGEGRNPVVALAGPSFAKQICQMEATAVTVASKDEGVARRVAQDFSTPLFKCYYNTDIVGAELSGALKNVVAIACGMCIGCPTFNVPAEVRSKLSSLQEAIRALPGLSAAKADELAALVSPEDVIDESIAHEYMKKKGGRGLGLGPNATNFVLTRAWEDVRKMCVAKGARSETLLSLSGLGDLMLTCFGGESRNAKFGSILGGAAASGTREEDACAEHPTINFVLDNPDDYPVTEGYWTSLALKDMATELNVELPVLSKMCDVLSGKMDPRDLIGTTMTEPVGPEFDGSYEDRKLVVAANPLHMPPAVQRRNALLNRIRGVAGESDAAIRPSCNPSSIALLMIEFQNEFATPGGKMHASVQEVMGATDMLANAAQLCQAARKRGCRIIHAPIAFQGSHADNPNRELGILKGCKDGALFTEKTWNAEYCAEMRMQEGDLEVLGKHGLDCFPNTTLEALLVEHGIETVVIGGFLTSCCVESTMRSAYEKGYNVVTLTDCTADTSMAGYKAATEGTFKLFSSPMTAKQFESEYLRGEAPMEC